MTLTIHPFPSGFALHRAGNPILTPKRNPLVMPTEALAKALKTELEKAAKTTPPLAAMAYTALDIMPASHEAMVEALLAYGETDQLLTRADQGTELLELEQQAWDPLVNWVCHRFDVGFVPSYGIMPVEQSEETITILRRVLGSYDNFTMAAFSVLVQASGSLILALAVKEHEITAQQAFTLSRVDEYYQNKRWGSDTELNKRAEMTRNDMIAAAALLEILYPPTP